MSTYLSKVVDYKVQISETGTEYNETIEVDTGKQTELFKVPAHDDVDESNILHDFKTASEFLFYVNSCKCISFYPIDNQTKINNLMFFQINAINGRGNYDTIFVNFGYCLQTPFMKDSSFLVKQNMTMMLLPEKKICYLMPLSEEVPTPAKLESDLDQTEVRTCSFL